MINVKQEWLALSIRALPVTPPRYKEVANRYDEQQIVSGEILACRWVKAAARRQLNDLEVSTYSKWTRVHYPTDSIRGVLTGRIQRIFASIQSTDGVGARCLELTILASCRSGESRLAAWSEINLESALDDSCCTNKSQAGSTRGAFPSSCGTSSGAAKT
jgi:hypothetical protein